MNNNIKDMRRDYTLRSIDDTEIVNNPFVFFSQWFSDALESNIIEPNIMTLSTVGENMRPSSRTVLLKQFDEHGFVFFTNYQSKKAQELEIHPSCSLLFLWLELQRQVSIAGIASRISRSESKLYFHSRPRESQIGAWASQQSAVASSRSEIDEKFRYYSKQFEGSDIPLPDFWGGYLVVPDSVEFWQGRESRLHDRISYKKTNGVWDIQRLYP